jgi:hypothetical protein
MLDCELHFAIIMNKHAVFLYLAIAGAVSAQVVSFGVRGGIPLTDQTSPQDESRPYIVGPSVEFKLPARFAVEAEALYQRVGNSSTFLELTGTASTSFIIRQRGNEWEFPLLGKYYFKPRSTAWQPYIETGWAFRTATIHSAANQTVSGSTPFSFNGDYRTPLGVGAVFGAGVRFHTGRIALSPEVRYTRWGSQDNVFRQNEAGVLLGVHF